MTTANTTTPRRSGGDIPFEYAALGLVDGWNALEIIQDKAPILYDTDAIPLPLNLIPDEEVTIGGTFLHEAENPRIVLIDGQALETGRLGYMMWDQAVEATWELSLSTPAYEDHISDITGTGLYAAIEVPIAYDDLDGNGEIDEGEPLGPTCSGENLAGLLWIAPPTEPILAYYLAAAGWGPQWLPFQDDPDGDDLLPLTAEERNNLVIGPECAFE